MAIVKNGINGNFSGKTAKVVGYELFGQQIMRGMPRKRTSKPTEKELINRAKFKASQTWLQPIIDFLRVGFQNYQPTFQGFVANKSYNAKHALKTDDDINFYINPADALVSYGTMDQLVNPSVAATKPLQLTFEWDKGKNFVYSDQVMVLAYAIEEQKAIFNTALAPQQNGTATLHIPAEYKAKDFHIYIAVVADSRKNRR